MAVVKGKQERERENGKCINTSVEFSSRIPMSIFCENHSQYAILQMCSYKMKICISAMSYIDANWQSSQYLKTSIIVVNLKIEFLLNSKASSRVSEFNPAWRKKREEKFHSFLPLCPHQLVTHYIHHHHRCDVCVSIESNSFYLIIASPSAHSSSIRIWNFISIQFQADCKMEFNVCECLHITDVFLSIVKKVAALCICARHY